MISCFQTIVYRKHSSQKRKLDHSNFYSDLPSSQLVNENQVGCLNSYTYVQWWYSIQYGYEMEYTTFADQELRHKAGPMLIFFSLLWYCVLESFLCVGTRNLQLVAARTTNGKPVDRMMNAYRLWIVPPMVTGSKSAINRSNSSCTSLCWCRLYTLS